jgi:hypothetical protein
VLPSFRPNGRPLSDDEPKYGYRTNLEYAVRRRQDVPRPTVVKDGYLIDVYDAPTDKDARIRPWIDEGTDEALA